jgi:type II secretory pathway component PulM
MSDDPRHHTALRPEHAFVVQFGPVTQVDAGPVEGRVEHLVSRQATRFQSLEALLAFVSRVLREVRDADSAAES